jgi:hypothetical protein
MAIDDDGPGGFGASARTYGQTYREKMLHADIAFLFYRDKGKLDITKNRYGVHGNDIPIEVVKTIFSEILTDMAFKGNNLRMFKEGLKEQIENAINETIKKFHERSK